MVHPTTGPVGPHFKKGQKPHVDGSEPPPSCGDETLARPRPAAVD